MYLHLWACYTGVLQFTRAKSKNRRRRYSHYEPAIETPAPLEAATPGARVVSLDDALVELRLVAAVGPVSGGAAAVGAADHRRRGGAVGDLVELGAEEHLRPQLRVTVAAVAHRRV